MSKFYRCDKCGDETPCLYDLCALEKTISVCRDCYYQIPLNELSSGEFTGCTDCEKG